MANTKNVKLLFVCVGNTCRSQMAEAIAKDLGHEASSAGTHPGKKIATNAIKVLSEIGLSVENQYPKSTDDIENHGFDKIISMGCGVDCPNLGISQDWNLEDPYGREIDFYRETRDKIFNYLSDL
ncbi:MAG: low molecular weight phosphatase family protein [Euryarchaeota archaeon]|nr:low molecular weight phosphatase family protein [Euryarchaeota archaeon]|tara:strand:+ start:7208 stop:7582 length:375 start_codon:yes stop_codon:yes gene_type:complete